MGYSYDDDDMDAYTGEIVYRKKHIRLHNRILKMKQHKSKHTYFDNDGNEVQEAQVCSVFVFLLILKQCGGNRA